MQTIQELEKLTDDELRVMLAKLAGWLEVERCSRNSLNPHPQGAQFRGTKDTGSERTYIVLPNYPADLNACHAVLHAITPAQHSAYQVHLADLSGNFRNAIDAPPRERTIALIATLQA